MPIISDKAPLDRRPGCGLLVRPGGPAQLDVLGPPEVVRYRPLGVGGVVDLLLEAGQVDVPDKTPLIWSW